MQSPKDSYGGSILFVDLTTRNVRLEKTPEGLKRQFLGGNGFAVKLLYDLVGPGIDPLGPGNALVFAVGPATGTLIPSSSRFVVGTKSPLTGLFFDSYAGGPWAEELKAAGCDALVVTGTASTPLYLVIEDDQVHFYEASHLWGLNTFAAQNAIRDELGLSDMAVAAIGPAGERLVRYAAILAGTRAAGRGGAGAVMGSKKLKAIGVRGTRQIAGPDPKGMQRFFQESFLRFKGHPATGSVLPQVGTGAGVAAFNKLGILGARNWQVETFEGAGAISAERLRDGGYFLRSKACPGCPIRCSKITCVPGPGQAQVLAEGPEYETLYSFGSVLGNENVVSIIQADRLCDEYGIDTISAGVAIAFAMEAFERGVIGETETDGLSLTFGNHGAALKLLQQIAHREGFGDILAEGVRRAAELIGRGSERYAIHVKGLELAGHTARALKGMALGYAVSTRGGSHQDTRSTVERSGLFDPAAVAGKGVMARDSQDMTAVGDSLIICRYTEAVFGFFLGQDHVCIANLTTGFDYSLEELRRVGERIYTLERMFNVREGIGRKEDTLPERFFSDAIPTGPNAGSYIRRADLDLMLDEYYEARGWDKATGIPTPAKLRELGLKAGYHQGAGHGQQSGAG